MNAGHTSRRCLAAVAITLAPVLASCAEDAGHRDLMSGSSSLSVPVPPEEVTLTASISEILGSHALELGKEPTLVLVLEGVPSSLRPGVEVQATGSIRVFREELGAELGIPLSGRGLERFKGAECLVVASLALPDRPLEVP